MGDGRRGSLTDWGTLIGGIATVGLAVVAYLTYVQRRDNLGQQTFSVPISSGSLVGSTDRKQSSLDFEVKKCVIQPQLVSCSLAVVSPRYDRRLIINPYGTRLVDSDGDSFEMVGAYMHMALDRDQKLPFKLTFAVNKDVVRPLTVKMSGSIDREQLDRGFEIK
jgi:hypothetical protein